MSERYETRFSNSFLLMAASRNNVKTKAECEALEEWKVLEVKTQVKQEQLRFLNETLKDFSDAQKDSPEYKMCQEEVAKCVSDCESYERQQERLLYGGPLSELYSKIHSWNLRMSQGLMMYANSCTNPNWESEAIRKHHNYSANTLEALYTKETQTLTGKKNTLKAKYGFLIPALDQHINEINDAVCHIEEQLAGLKWCLSKKKRDYKKKLAAELERLSNYLKLLQTKRRLWLVIR